MKGYNHFALVGGGQPKGRTYLWVQVVYPGDRIFNVTALKGFPDVHSPFDTFKINGRRKASFLAEFFCGDLVTLNDEVIHY